MKEAAKISGGAVQFNRIGSMFCGYFTSEPVHNLADAMKSDRATIRQIFPRHVEARDLPCAFTIRGRVHFHRPHDGRHCKDCSGRE
jgi:hypothetical protein